MDPPDMIVEGALEAHRRMVREYAGVPGVRPDKVAEGLQVRARELAQGTPWALP